MTINGQFIELADVASLGNTSGNVNETGWTTYTYTATQTGTLTIGFAVVDVGDAVVNSALLIDNVQVNSGNSIPLDINATFADNDGSEQQLVTISGLPEGASLSAGTDLGDGVWSLTPAQLVGLSLIPPTYFDTPINLLITATATETSNGDEASTSTTLTIDPPYSDNFFARESSPSDMSLMVADTTEAPEQMMFAAASEPAAKSSLSSFARRGDEWRGHSEAATMQAIAAAAGFATFAPQWAHAQAHLQADDQGPTLASDGDGDSWLDGEVIAKQFLSIGGGELVGRYHQSAHRYRWEEC